MTPEEFEDLVRNAKSEDLPAAFSELDDKARKKLVSKLKELRKAVKTGDGMHTGRLEWEQEREIHHHWSRTRPMFPVNADLALFAVGSLTDCKRTHFEFDFSDLQGRRVVAILADRKPEWLDAWVEAKLTDGWGELNWTMVRQLYEDGVIGKPAANEYIDMFSRALCRSNPPTSKRLLAQPDFLDEDIWRLFEVETLAFYDDDDFEEPGPGEYEPFAIAIRKLIESGHLDRDRVLDAALGGLDNDLKQPYLAGFTKLYDFLEPTAEEEKAREARFLDVGR